MKKILVILALIFTSLLISNTEVEATKLHQNAYSDINEFDGITNVVIFIKFNDEVNYEAPHDFPFYESMFNGVDQISLRDYFLEVSYNQFTIDSIFTHNDEIVFYVSEHNRAYYEEYDEDTNPEGYQTDEEQRAREHTLLKNAVTWVDENNLIPDTVNLDVNDDDDIDSITFMVSGEDNGWNSLLWPHKWSIYNNVTIGINGVRAYDYTFELLGNNAEYGYAVDVAVLAHETFHLISAPDLYHYYDYDWIDSIGEWGLMSTIGTVPSHMLGYMKYQYGNWANDATDITESGMYTLYPLQDASNNMYKIALGYSNEYIYIEYRDSDGDYESTLPSSGLLVYRIDKDYIGEGNENGYYYENKVQEEVWLYRPYMEDVTYPIEFSEEEPAQGDEDGDPYYAALSDSNTHSEIGVGTDILLFDSEGNEIDIKITSIQEHDGYMTFYVHLNDHIMPEITLNGSEYMRVEYDEEYIDPGYIVNVEGYSVVVSGRVDIHTLGEYEITYSLKDPSGSIVDVETRTVTVVDTTAPEAYINIGLDTINLGEEWIDGGVTVSDNEDTDLKIEVSSELDNTKEGTYLVEYKVIDNEGNYVITKRYVTVMETSYSIAEEFTCSNSKTTFQVGELLKAPSCEYNNQKVEPTNLDEISNSTSGVYELQYEVTLGDQTHIFRTYIFVINDYPNIVAIIEERRRYV